MRAIVLVLSVLLAVAAMPLPGGAQHQHRAHEHGAARLQVSLEGSALQVVFEGPADNVLGFEHAPRTPAQKEAVTRAQERLGRGAELFATPPAAECRPEPARVELKLPGAGSKETHSEVEAEWRWACAKPGALAWIDVGLFKAFPRLKQLRAQVATARGQTAATLKAGAARLKIGA